MPKLDFDFCAQPKRTSWGSWVLLLAGLSALAWTWMNFQAARATEAGLELQLAALARPHAQPTTQAPRQNEDAAAQANVAAQLAYSWQPAFDALATASSKKIALVSLEANQEKKQLKLVAEARQLADAVAYIEVLQQQPGVKNATLTQHEVQDKPEQRPVRFNILVEFGA